MAGNVSSLKPEHDDSLNPVQFNITEAIKILNDAGWRDTDNDRIRDKIISGEKTDLNTELYYLSSATEWMNPPLKCLNNNTLCFLS